MKNLRTKKKSLQIRETLIAYIHKLNGYLTALFINNFYHLIFIIETQFFVINIFPCLLQSFCWNNLINKVQK